MFTRDWFEILETVEESYIGFRPFRDGSKSDKCIFVSLWMWFAIFGGFFFWATVFDKKSIAIITPLINLILQISSLLVFLCYDIFFLKCLQKKDRTENFIYRKGQKKEEEFLGKFIFNLSKRNISIDRYSSIIEYYENKIQKEKGGKTNEFHLYITVFLIPFLISYFSTNQEIKFYLLQLAVSGLIIVPLCMMCVNQILNKKLYMYEHIVYYLRLQIQIEKL